MSRKIKILAALAVLVAGAAAYELILHQQSAKAGQKVEGQVYVLPKEFLINLAGERYAKVNVALVIEGDDPIEPGHGSTPPEGFGPLAQEAVVRDIVTDTLTDLPAEELTGRPSRRRVKATLKRKVASETDVPVGEVLLTDVAIQ